jgi:tRNA A37 methylthiotransferase MiaB
MNLHIEICKENQKPWLGKQVRVFVDKKGFENTWLGRSSNYKLFAIHSKEKILGRFVNVKVKKLLPHYLISELI